MNGPGIGTEWVVDTSVVVKFHVQEADSSLADGVLEKARRQAVRLVTLDLMLAEFLNTLWVKTRRGELTPEEAEEKIADLLFISHWMTIVPLRSLSPESFRAAWRLGHAVYDAAFLALAEAWEAPLITADEAFYNKARSQTDLVVLLRHL